METNYAKATLRRYWNGQIPVDPSAIARNMGVLVDPSPYIAPASGCFEMVNNEPVIRFNPDEPLLRQRFTVAHELGHFVLAHGSAFRDTTDQFSTYARDPKEVAANRFAAELLMPKEAVDQLIKDGITQPSSLAKKFGVSEVAMTYRLKNLGWI